MIRYNMISFCCTVEDPLCVGIKGVELWTRNQDPTFHGMSEYFTILIYILLPLVMYSVTRPINFFSIVMLHTVSISENGLQLNEPIALGYSCCTKYTLSFHVIK